MLKKEFYFPSSDGQTQIHVIQWFPEAGVKAVLQISHGMVEYIDRYDEFARYLAERGFCVVGHDHLGHGIPKKENLQQGNGRETIFEISNESENKDHRSVKKENQ